MAASLHVIPSKPRVHAESALRLELANGSRVVSLPGSEKTTRGYSKANLVILDEASRIEDSLISSLRPMQAVSKGARFVVMSTPWGRRGFFFERWRSTDPGWLKVEVAATECPRIPEEFLREQERELGPLLFRQEYRCDLWTTRRRCSARRWWRRRSTLGCGRCSGWRMRRDAGCTYPKHWTMGVDLGQAHDPTAIAVVETVLTVRWWDDDGDLRRRRRSGWSTGCGISSGCRCSWRIRCSARTCGGCCGRRSCGGASW